MKDETLAVISNESETNHRVSDICKYIYIIATRLLLLLLLKIKKK